jgi:hypothetical protein
MYYVHIDQHCSYCGAIETDQHLFFKCSLPTQVWSNANPPIFTNNIPDEVDGIQETLPTLISANPSDNIIFKFLFILWYIWKARNDHMFQRRRWTSTQIHSAANAHMNNHLQALTEQISHNQLMQANTQPIAAQETRSTGMNTSYATTNPQPVAASLHQSRRLHQNQQATSPLLPADQQHRVSPVASRATSLDSNLPEPAPQHLHLTLPD